MSLVYADPRVLFDRALRRVRVTPEGCWEYTGCVTSRGYACVASGRKSKSILGHRLAVLASGRAIPEGMSVDHRCHVTPCAGGDSCPHRRCIRPDHLAVVTPEENTRRRAGELHSPEALPPLPLRGAALAAHDTFVRDPILAIVTSIRQAMYGAGTDLVHVPSGGAS